MSDFIKSIQVSLQQLDYTKQNGIVNGLSNVIIENMNNLFITSSILELNNFNLKYFNSLLKNKKIYRHKLKNL